VPMGVSMAGIATNINTEPQRSSPPVSSSSSGTMTPQKLALLRELAELRSQGILTEEEFGSEKQKLLTTGV